MHRTEHFIASAERDGKIIETMRHPLFATELVKLAAVEMNGIRWQLDFVFEIARLKDTLRMMGVDDNERLSRPPRTRAT